jgi:hypothetical protein
MKNQCPLFFALGLIVGGIASEAKAAFVFTSTSITASSQITLPTGMTTVVQAVNVGSLSASTVNGITFVADSGNWPAANAGGVFVGNGYTASGFTESASGVSGAGFTTTTINPGSNGYLIGTPVTNLNANTDYVFQVFLSDYHTQRGSQLSYTLGSVTETQSIQQTLGSENCYQVSFNSGSETTFSWRLDSIVNHHDAKVAGFALYSAVIPEPSMYGMIFSGVLFAITVIRRRCG